MKSYPSSFEEGEFSEVLDQWFLTFACSTVTWRTEDTDCWTDLVGCEGGGAVSRFAFLTCSQAMLMLLVLGPQIGNCSLILDHSLLVSLMWSFKKIDQTDGPTQTNLLVSIVHSLIIVCLYLFQVL